MVNNTDGKKDGCYLEGQGGKKTWGAVMAAALLAGAGFLYAGEEESPAPAAVSDTERSALPKSGGRQEIAGWQKAEETETVRNPFSLRHETAEELSQAVPEKPEKPVEKAQPSVQEMPKAKPPEPAGILPEAGEAPPAAPLLRGVLEGEGGKIAMIQIAGQTASLSAGESFQDCTVLAIEENSIVIQRRGQEKRLFLPEY